MKISLAMTLRAIIFLLCCMWLAACSSPQPPLRVALLEWPPYELAFWARDRGWLDAETVQLLEYKTPAEVTRAFATDSVDIIAVTADFALSLATQYPDTRLFLIIDASNGGDVVLSKQAINDRADLSGKTLAVEAGPLGFYMLSRFRQHYQLSKSDLHIEYIDIPAQVEHWKTSDVDLMITYEPNRSRILKEGAVEIFTSRQIPNEIVDVFLVKQHLIETRNEDLQHFVDGWFRAVSDLNTAAQEVYQFIGGRENIPAQLVKEAFEQHLLIPDRGDNLRLLSGVDPSFRDGLKRNERVMLDEGIINRKVDRRTLLTDALVQ